MTVNFFKITVNKKIDNAQDVCYNQKGIIIMDNLNKNHKEIFFTRAEMKEAERICCDNCFEQVIFMMRDKEHEFSIGLATVLECITFAIKNGDLPKLPQSWLSDIDSIYNTDYAYDNDISYFDSNFPRKRE